MNDLKQLVPIQEQKIGETFQKCVSARQLHEYLKIKSRFATWISNRINKFEFIENYDYFTFSKNLENGGKLREYAITLDMAKQLTMVENNGKGSQARRYFINCEKALRQVVSHKEYYSIAEYAERKNIILTDFEEEVIWAKGAVDSHEKGKERKYVNDEYLLHYTIIQPIFAAILEKRKARTKQKENKLAKKEEFLFFELEKQQLQNFIIHKGLTQEYREYVQR